MDTTLEAAKLCPQPLLQFLVDCAMPGDEQAPVIIEPTAPHTHTYIHCVELGGRAESSICFPPPGSVQRAEGPAKVMREVMAPRLPSVRWIVLSVSDYYFLYTLHDCFNHDYYCIATEAARGLH